MIWSEVVQGSAWCMKILRPSFQIPHDCMSIISGNVGCAVSLFNFVMNQECFSSAKLLRSRPHTSVAELRAVVILCLICNSNSGITLHISH